MARIQVKEGTRYVFKKQIYRVKQILADNRYLVENLSNGGEEIINHEDIIATWSNGSLRFEVVSANATQDVEASLKTRYVDDDLGDLPQSVREETWRRYQLVLTVYQYYQIETTQMLTRRQIEVYVANTEQVGDQRGTSVGTIERYMQSFIDSGRDIRSLVPQTRQRGGKDQSRLDEAIERIIETVLEKYATITERESTVDQIITDVVNAIGDENRFRDPDDQLMLPSERTIRRRIKAAGERRVLGRRLSRREQKSQAETEPGPRPTRILERVEIDHTTLNLFVVDEQDGLPIGRPYITACIDKYSALVPGWHIGFNQGGYKSIMLCLQHAFLPKPDYRALYGTEHDYPVYGLFEKLCIDNGQDFKSADLKNALAELGIIREEMPKETPWFKGSIERYFRSVNQRLLKGKPGYTFENVLALGDYDAQKDAVISLSAFLEIFHIFMVDIYPYTWHTGLEAIPMQRWQESAQLFTPDLFEDATALKRVLLPSAERVLQAKGIEWERNFYRGPELARLREFHGKEKVRFKYNPDDMDAVYVRDRSSPTGWVEFHSTNPDYTRGLSWAKHQVIRQYLNAQKQTIDRFSLARAKGHIQKVIEREFFTTKKIRRRSRLKPLLKSETSSAKESESTPVVSPPNLSSENDRDDLLELKGWSSDYGLPITGDDHT
jgi:putative transposase